MNVMEEIEI